MGIRQYLTRIDTAFAYSVARQILGHSGGEYTPHPKSREAALIHHLAWMILYRSGWSSPAIASAAGRRPETVASALKNSTLAKDPEAWEVAQAVVELAAAGHNPVECARAVRAAIAEHDEGASQPLGEHERGASKP